MDIARILQTVPLFGNLGLKSIRALIPLFENEFYPKNEKIVREGELGKSMFIIIEGIVHITKEAEKSHEILISEMHKGAYFGEIALIDNQPRSANAIAKEDTRVLRLRKSVFEKLLDENRVFAINFYRNCLKETISRMRETASNLTWSQDILNQKSSRLDMINADLSDAKVIQDYFINKDQLNQDCFKQNGIIQSHLYKPYIEIGGDFLSAASIDENKVGILIADVMGHGISAAMATGVLRSGFTIFSKQYGSEPAELMRKLNIHTHEIFTSLYATGYYALVDVANLKIALSKAGHMHPLIWSDDQGRLLDINIPGPGLGIVPNAEFETMEISVEKGDKLLLFTDGIIEQRNEDGEMYALERLEKTFSDLCRNRNDKIIKSIYKDFKNFCREMELQDDVTLFLLEF